MALTPDQINKFTLRAKQAGYSDPEIQQEIARKSAEVQAPVTPQQPVTPQTPQIQATPQKSIAGSVGSGAITGAKSAASVIGSVAMNAPQLALDIAKEFVKPAVKGAKTIASAGEEAIQTGQYLAGNKEAFNSPILPDSIKLSQQEKDKIRNKPLDSAIEQTAGIGSYAIPFGKAGFIGSKAVLPGAAVAGMRSVSEGDTPEEVLGNAIIGGGTAGALQIGGKVLGKLKGAAAKTAVAADSGVNAIEQGTRQIRVKPSIYGASKEKSINSTLDRLGFKGSPQNQYENLQPAMEKLEGQIKEFIAQNPNISVRKASIKESFLTSLKSSLRSGEITEKQAVSETNKYLNDLVKASGGTGKFTDIPLSQLRTLKKLVNEDYGTVKKIIDNGGSLTPKQRVIAVAWDSLDNAVKQSAPQVKSLLTDESNLYGAAQSLSGARSNPPVLRAMGTSVPQPITQIVRDTAKQGLRTTATAADAMSKVIPSLPNNPALVNIAGQTAATLPSIGATPPSLNEMPDEGQNPVGTDQGQIQTNDQQYNTHDNSLAQNPQDTTTQPAYINQWGATPAELYREYQNAYQFGDIKTAAYLYKVYQDEVKNQKENAPAKQKSLSGAVNKEIARNTTALKDIDQLDTILEEDPNKIIQSAVPGSLGARKYRALWGGIIDAIGTNRTGATYTPEQRKDYAYLLPALGDTPEEVRYKMTRLRAEVQNFIDTVSGSGPDYVQGLGSPQEVQFQDYGLGESPQL